MTCDEILAEVKAEVERAEGLYGKFCSGHEGYAVIKEEVEELRDVMLGNMPWASAYNRCPFCELWSLVKESKGVRCTDEMKNEAVQVCAMAVRFIENLS